MTTDTTELVQSLKAAAEKASGGDWVKESGDGWDATCSNDDQANSGFIIAHFVGPDSAENREFVQLANPANVLALVEALEKAQAKATQQGNIACALFDEVTQLRRHADEKAPELRAQLIEADSELEALRQRIAELESRTVKLPARCACEGYHIDEAYLVEDPDGDCYDRDEVLEALTAAGIKWEAE